MSSNIPTSPSTDRTKTRSRARISSRCDVSGCRPKRKTSMPKCIRIATLGVANDYRQSIVPLVVQSLGFRIDWAHPSKADLLIFGPFYKPKNQLRWLPKPIRPAFAELMERLQGNNRPVTLFQTGENLRHNHIPCDYSVSFDLAVDDPRHCRFPYWMEMVDWSHEGVSGNQNPRFGRLLDLDRLMRPLGREFLAKPKRAAIFASHLQEPRATLIKAVERHIRIQGFGPVFDATIAHHSRSKFTKIDVLKDFAFNLCPENSMYPGYYTEKIPEAFMANCLPLAWTDSNVNADFNPEAIINMGSMMADDFADLSALLTEDRLTRYSEQPLLSSRPSISSLVLFLKEITIIATT